jgi:hypothetical protein
MEFHRKNRVPASGLYHCDQLHDRTNLELAGALRETVRHAWPLVLALLAGCRTVIVSHGEPVINPHCLAFCRFQDDATLRDKIAARLKSDERGR